MGYALAVDIGGTFTDLVALEDETGELVVAKSGSHAMDPISAVLRVIEKAGIPVAEAEMFMHGTTVATNALIERAGARVAYITNTGFRDAIFIQNANRRDLYSLEWKKPRPLASRHDCLEIDCRVDSRGRVLKPVDPAEVGAVSEHLRREGITSVAISFLFSYLNASHELEVAELLYADNPELSISLSHEVYPRWRENDRGHTTIADAYLKPMFARYAKNLQDGLTGAGSRARVLIMKSNGGVVEADVAARQPVNYLVSGPVGGVMGGTHFASAAGFDRVMTIDIGGTSCDVSLVDRGELPRSSNFEIEFGMPVRAPMVDIRTIGAGGGSIAWIDAGGLLRVGPQSAGSNPGPACYGQGGAAATVTDANLVLGRLNAENFCGGDIPLDASLATGAVADLAESLGSSPDATAYAIIELANHNMVDALSVISVEKGIDPRDFCLVAFGGAGALHAAEIAGIIGIGTVLVPPYPGNTSAYGLLTAGLQTDVSTTLLIRSDDPDRVAKLNERLVALRERATETLRREGYRGEPMIDQRLEMRYFGQNYHREVVLAGEVPLDEDDFDAAVKAFNDDYRAFYGYDQPRETVETVGVIVRAIGERSGPAPRFGKPEAVEDADVSRPVYFATDGFRETGVVAREALRSGDRREGPLVVEEALSTTLVPPGTSVTVDGTGSLIIHLHSGANDE
jgi:N-methylhydantoinase A